MVKIIIENIVKNQLSIAVIPHNFIKEHPSEQIAYLVLYYSHSFAMSHWHKVILTTA